MKLLTCCLALALAAATADAAQVELTRPFGSTQFGTHVRVLPNGNIVVVDPAAFDVFANSPGAVHLYRPDGSLISTLRGGRGEDRIGSGGIVVLPTGNFLVLSPDWEGPQQAIGAGAVTFVDGARGLEGHVTADNSLVGRAAGDGITLRAFVLPNGNYVVSAPLLDDGALVDVGAAAFGDGRIGARGVIGAHNALLGSSAGDRYGEVIYVLASGDYVVCAANWNHGALADAGAATFASGTDGRSGVVSAQNSLVGGSAGDRVCLDGVAPAFDPSGQATSSNRYAVRSHLWRNGNGQSVGAVTVGSGPMGIAGVVSSANSIVGSSSDDAVGEGLVYLLADGTLAVAAPGWDRPGATPVVDAGAVLVGPATTVGVLSAANALVGSSAGDQVGSSVEPLPTGHFLALTPAWRNGNAQRAGAASFIPASGRSGAVSAANSLVGSSSNDEVGARLLILGNGNYLLAAPGFDRGAVTDAGAVLLGSGTSGLSGTISASNALLGARANDRVGSSLRRVGPGNVNYLVISPDFSAGGVPATGAVSFASGVTGLVGEPSATNSLFGSSPQDGAGLSANALASGDFIVRAPNWDRPLAGALVADAGAIAAGSGSHGLTGVISAQNALVGSSAGDHVGNAITTRPDGSFLALSRDWDNGSIVDAGAITWVSPSGLTGAVSPANSVVGVRSGDRVGSGLRSALGDLAVLVFSPDFDAGANADAGAATRMVAGLSGPLTAANSLLGASAGERLGSGNSEALAGGFFALESSFGARSVSLLRNDGGSVGLLGPAHTVSGTPMTLANPMKWSFDAARVQLVVGEGDANKVTLLRPGLATTLLLTAAPLPSQPGQAVTLTARVSTANQAANQGRVEFRASDGRSCSDTTPTPVSATASEFSCQLSFPRLGRREIVAEYLGSLNFAYSAARIEHSTGEGVLSIDGFE